MRVAQKYKRAEEVGQKEYKREGKEERLSIISSGFPRRACVATIIFPWLAIESLVWNTHLLWLVKKSLG